MSRSIVVLILISLLFWSSLSFANSYVRGSWSCEDFAEGERLHKKYPDDVDFKTGYARCLVLKGEVEGNRSLISDGLKRLYNLVEFHNEVYAAWIIANHIKTGGTFEKDDEDKYNEARSAFVKVWALINRDPSYPHNGNRIYELDLDIHIRTAFYAALMAYSGFTTGLESSNNALYIASPSYTGNKDLKTFSQYDNREGLLKLALEYAEDCLAVPRHFNSHLYNYYRNGCLILKTAIEGTEEFEDLVSLEMRRQTALITTVTIACEETDPNCINGYKTQLCKDDILQCEEYHVIFDQLWAQDGKVYSDLNANFAPAMTASD